MTIHVSVCREGGAPAVVVAGELDTAAVPALESAIREVEQSGSPRIVVDLSALEFMDSSGLLCLMKAGERCREAGRDLVLIPGPPQVQRVFDLTGTDSQFQFSAPYEAAPVQTDH